MDSDTDPPAKTTIQISNLTKVRLLNLREKRETYNDIINRVLDHNEEGG